MSGSPNYWMHKIHRPRHDGTPEFVARYMSETFEDSAATDLGTERSRLRQFLSYFTKIVPEKFIEEHHLEAQALLAGLVATEDCLVRLGIWLPMEPPRAESIRPPTKLESSTATEGKVRIWFLEKADGLSPF
jgi:hypothetical protein